MLEIMVDDAVWTDVEEGTEALLQEWLVETQLMTQGGHRLLGGMWAQHLPSRIAGHDADHGRRSSTMHRVARAPFYAAQV